MKKTISKTISITGPSTRYLSGISYYTIRLCNALSEMSTINAILFRNMLPKRLFPGWKRVGRTEVTIHLHPSVMVFEGLDWYNPFSWARGARIIRRSDVAILQWWTSSVAHMYLALIGLSGRRCRFVIEFHEVVDPLEYAILPLRLYAKTMGRIIRDACFRYIVHSVHDRDLISSQYGIQSSKISVIPHGLYDQYPILDKETSKRRLGVKGNFLILFFGLLRPYKGVSLLVSAYEKLPPDIRDRATLIIAGEAWEDQEVIAQIERSEVRSSIIFENRYIADEEIPHFFSAADLLVLPYTRASQSGVAHIGIAYGLPIIASRVGGLSESLGSYDGTAFIESGDSDDLVKKIEHVYQNESIERYHPPDDMRWDRIAAHYVQELNLDSGDEI